MATAAERIGLPDRIRLPLSFDPAPLAADLAKLGGAEWIRHFVPRNYEGEWSALPLRAAAGATHPIQMIASDPSATAFVDTPLLGELPNIAAALSRFGCPLSCVRLMRLTPGSAIREHRDHDLDAALGWARIHVPITTNPGVTFHLNGVAVEMAPGEAWYLRLTDPHRAANGGASDRIHLVIDAQVDGWLAAQLESRAAREPQAISASA